MANIFVPQESAIVVKLEVLTLSGTVSVDGSPEIRNILIYKMGDDENITASTWSNASGAWGVAIIAGPNDRFRAVMVGLEGETSEIYEDVTAG